MADKRVYFAIECMTQGLGYQPGPELDFETARKTWDAICASLLAGKLYRRYRLVVCEQEGLKLNRQELQVCLPNKTPVTVGRSIHWGESER